MVLISNLLSPPANAADAKLLSTVVQADDIQWGYLNPLRGDKSPGAADLWGDRKKNLATGMLVKFNKGFSSPPHIHNISYRGVVIEGMMHNNDPKAEKMWMSTGSFLTQPAGANHITAADGAKNLIYLEIDSGPYLVKPSYERFDNGEKPINLHESNLVWLNQNDLKSVDANDAELTTLWGSTKHGELGGSLVKLQAGFNGKIEVNAKEFRSIVIKGCVTYDSSETQRTTDLSPGSYFSSTGEFEHRVSVKKTIVYIRTDGRYKVSSN